MSALAPPHPIDARHIAHARTPHRRSPHRPAEARGRPSPTRMSPRRCPPPRAVPPPPSARASIAGRQPHGSPPRRPRRVADPTGCRLLVAGLLRRADDLPDLPNFLTGEKKKKKDLLHLPHVCGSTRLPLPRAPPNPPPPVPAPSTPPRAPPSSQRPTSLPQAGTRPTPTPRIPPPSRRLPRFFPCRDPSSEPPHASSDPASSVTCPPPQRSAHDPASARADEPPPSTTLGSNGRMLSMGHGTPCATAGSWIPSAIAGPWIPRAADACPSALPSRLDHPASSRLCPAPGDAPNTCSQPRHPPVTRTAMDASSSSTLPLQSNVSDCIRSLVKCETASSGDATSYPHITLGIHLPLHRGHLCWCGACETPTAEAVQISVFAVSESSLPSVSC
ncbi:vegetative cell wall protein gp1 [Triticum aestivum]|uniref:vegetative cell wall protein gp1 n=1 Tax=Triticum aestivum TaxID=4565 RepID=UPI001D034176|nr:vegetative cell wall protein gp1-like [Triticum aestivum]